MSNQTSFSLPRERGEQLRQLAFHHRKSLAGLISDWIEAGLAEAGLSASLPDVKIEAGRDQVTLTTPELIVSFATAKDAWDTGESIDRVAKRGGAWVHADRRDGSMLSITRVGAGVVIELIDRAGAKSRRSFSRDVACAVARQLREAAEQALPSR